MSSPSVEDASGSGLEVPTIDISGFEGGRRGVRARGVGYSSRVRVRGLLPAGEPRRPRTPCASRCPPLVRSSSARWRRRWPRRTSRRATSPSGDATTPSVPPPCTRSSCARVDGVDSSDPYYGGDHPQARLYFGDDNRWPTAPAHFRDAYVAYYKAMEALVARLLPRPPAAPAGDADFFRDKASKHVTNLVARDTSRWRAATGTRARRSG